VLQGEHFRPRRKYPNPHPCSETFVELGSLRAIGATGLNPLAAICWFTALNHWRAVEAISPVIAVANADPGVIAQQRTAPFVSP
jgi:hypothetical protein